MGAKKNALIIIISIILTVFLVLTINVGLSIFLEDPSYNQYCNVVKPGTRDLPAEFDCTQLVLNERNQCCIDNGYGGYNESTSECYTNNCYEQYEESYAEYNQIRFYVFAGLGLVFLLIGLFAINGIVQWTGLATGGILVGQGIVSNWENKVIVFILLVLIVIIFGGVAWRVVRKIK